MSQSGGLEGADHGRSPICSITPGDDYGACRLLALRCMRRPFYDATLDWDYAREMNSARPDDGRMIPVGAGDMAAICVECAKTYKVVVKRKAIA